MLNIATHAAGRKASAQRPEIDGDVELPADLNPARYPILATHWFGWRPVGVVAAQIVQDLAFRRKVKRLHAKGPRVIAELLAELGAERGLGTAIDQIVDRYLELDDETLEAIGGRTLPPLPLHEVSR